MEVLSLSSLSSPRPSPFTFNSSHVLDLPLPGKTFKDVSLPSLARELSPSRTPFNAVPLASIFEFTRYRPNLALIGMGKDAAVFHDKRDNSILKIYCFKGEPTGTINAASLLSQERFSEKDGFNPFKFSIWKLGLIGMELDHRVRNHFIPCSPLLQETLSVPSSNGYGAFELDGFTYIVQKAARNTEIALPRSEWGNARRELLSISKQGLFIDLESPSNFRCSDNAFPITYLDLIFPTFTGEDPKELEQKLSRMSLSGLRGMDEIRDWLGEECVTV